MSNEYNLSEHAVNIYHSWICCGTYQSEGNTYKQFNGSSA